MLSYILSCCKTAFLYYHRDNSFRTLKVFSHWSCSFVVLADGCSWRIPFIAGTFSFFLLKIQGRGEKKKKKRGRWGGGGEGKRENYHEPFSSKVALVPWYHSDDGLRTNLQGYLFRQLSAVTAPLLSSSWSLPPPLCYFRSQDCY